MASKSANNDVNVNGGRPSWIDVPFLDLNTKTSSKDKNCSPSSSALIPSSDFEDAYGPFQALHIRGFTVVPSTSTITSSKSKCGSGSGRFQASDVQPLFESLNDQDKESWCVENEVSHRSQKGEEKAQIQMAPKDFLDVDNRTQRGYCSFLVQHTKTVMKDLFSTQLPMVNLPVAKNEDQPTTDDSTMEVRYGPCLWLFFGKNYDVADDENGIKSPAPKTLQGRPEHTDSVTHDGTWHYQLSGTKIWRLRPTTELIQRIKEDKGQQENTLSGTKRKIDDASNDDEADKANDADCDEESKRYIEVECKQGDILLLNTRLWWHSTLIPPQDVPCISYARDVYFPSSETTSDTSCDLEEEEEGSGSQERKQHNQQEQSSSMTNIDGTYAAEDIEAETVLFTENTMPDCELHRSKTNPNCQVVEMEDENTGECYMAVVSMRYIKAGEFFCILESDDEESEGDDDGSSEGGEMEEWEEE